MEIELMAIAGLDKAIIGTTICRKTEVLCYNYSKCVELVIAKGISEEDAELFIAELASSNVEGAPVFVQLNNEQLEYDGTSSGTVH
tara:strand:+ start:5233 stop:5490 length:258 start_codon:yes stop_codon:yes gene_type:complete